MHEAPPWPFLFYVKFTCHSGPWTFVNFTLHKSPVQDPSRHGEALMFNGMGCSQSFSILFWISVTKTINNHDNCCCIITSQWNMYLSLAPHKDCFTVVTLDFPFWAFTIHVIMQIFFQKSLFTILVSTLHTLKIAIGLVCLKYKIVIEYFH